MRVVAHEDLGEDEVVVRCWMRRHIVGYQSTNGSFFELSRDAEIPVLSEQEMQ